MSTDISVIIPTYNYARFINEAINSVLKQEFTGNKEIVIVDDGSTDNTKQVLQPFLEQNAVKYFFQQNLGKAAATYKAIKESSGKYIFNLDADDFYLPGKIAETVAIFEADNSIVHVASAAKYYIDGDKSVGTPETLPPSIIGKKWKGIELLKMFYNNNIFYGSGSTFAARASVLKEIIIPNAVDMYIDEFLLLSLLPKGDSYFLQQPFSVWRMHETNYSSKSNNLLKQKIKEERLLQSSEAVLQYLLQNNYDKELLAVYKIKHLNRLMAFKEKQHTKTIKDIAIYVRQIFFGIKPNWKLIKNYQVLNRLIPTGILFFLKKSRR